MVTMTKTDASRTILRSLVSGVLASIACVSFAGGAHAEGGFSNSVSASFMASEAQKSAEAPVAGAPYEVNGKWFVPAHEPDYDEVGIASWYGPNFHQKATATGETYNQEDFTGAHPTLPIPSMVRVTNLENGRTLLVRLNDRGPYVDDRLIDLSHGSAQALGVVGKGTAKVRVQYVGPVTAQISQGAAFQTASVNTQKALASTPIRATPVRLEGASTHEPSLMFDPYADAPISLTPKSQTSVDTGRAVRVTASAPAAIAYSPAPAPAPLKVAPAAAVSSGAFLLQAGAFGDLNNARKLQGQLASYGPVKVEAAEINGAHLYRVQVGPFASRDAALAAQGQLAAAGQKTLLQTAR
jgi:rare lipoprotein A